MDIAVGGGWHVTLFPAAFVAAALFAVVSAGWKLFVSR
jgi:hypothetical protein